MISSERLGQKLYVLQSEAPHYTDQDGWSVIRSKNTYNIDGHSYTAIEKKERYNTDCSRKRVTDIVIGLLFCLCTLGLALISKTVRQFFNGRQVVVILKPDSLPNVPSSQKNTNVISPPKAKSNQDTSNTHGKHKLTNKFFKSSVVDQDVKFKPLSQASVAKLLDKEPKLKQMAAAQGTMKAYDSILSIHAQGIPSRLGNGTSNDELMNQMRFILFKINEAKDEKQQKSMLRDLARCIEDCVPVTQGEISKMYQRFASVVGFDAQVASFIAAYKDRVVDDVIYQLYPEMKNEEYAQNHRGTPWLQFPHMKTGYLALVGDELGFNTAHAEEDPNKNIGITLTQLNLFKKLFKSEISIEYLVKEMIIDINGRNGYFDINVLSKWCTPDNLGDDASRVFYDSEVVYPSYSPPYKSNYGYEPYLTEELVYSILKKMGYIESI